MCKVRFILGLAIVLAGVASSGCSSSSPTTPTTTSVQGEWRGSTCAPSNITSCVIILRLEQSGTALSGTWARTAGNGTLTGTVSGTTVVLDLVFPSTPPTSTMTLNVQRDVMTGSLGTGNVRVTRNP